jgi:hypothetical protein
LNKIKNLVTEYEHEIQASWDRHFRA